MLAACALHIVCSVTRPRAERGAGNNLGRLRTRCSGWQKWRGLKRMDVAAIAWLTLASALKSASMALCCLREVSSVERCCAISSPRSFIDMATSCLCQAKESRAAFAAAQPRSKISEYSRVPQS